MAFKFEEGKMYMMPVYFGPSTVWHDLDGEKKLFPPTKVECLGAYFETNQEQIDKLLPEGFTSAAPVISVLSCEFADVGWLGGHTYNLININTPVHFKGEKDELDGDFILAMWENSAEPICVGRELNGYNKPYADIQRFMHFGSKMTSTASSHDFQFMKLVIDTDKPCQDEALIRQLEERTEGKFNYRYICNVDNYGVPDVAYPLFTPKKWDKPDDYPFELLEPQSQYCYGEVKFFEPSWEDMPVWYRTGKGLADLEIKRYIGGVRKIYSEPCDYFHHRRVY